MVHKTDGGGGDAVTLLADADQNELTRARLAAIVTSCPDPIIGETLDGIITDWNPAAERLYGFSAAEAVGQPLTILTPPERVDEIEACLVLVRQGEVIAEVETVRRAKDGRLIDVALTIFPVRDESGTIVGASSTTREVSGRRELEQALHTSEQKFRALVEHLPGVVYLLAADEKETPLYYSPYIKKLVGLEPDIVLQLTKVPQFSWLWFVHPDDRDWVAAINSGTLESGEQFRAEYRTLRVDGSYVWVRDESVPIYGDDGRIIAWQGVLFDISDRIEAEEAQARLAAIVESAEDAVISFALDGTIDSWNQGAERLYGYRAAEMTGQPYVALLPDSDAFYALPRLDELGEQPVRYEARRRHADGTMIDVAVSLSPIRERSGGVTGISAIIRDITARKRAEEALRVALEEAQAATRAKSQFLAILSHELRTPLQAVLGYADFLLNDPSATFGAEQREDVGYIHQGARRMVTLIDQMLDLSRMEAGHLELKMTDVDLAEIVEQVRQDVAPQAEAKGLSLTIAAAPDLLPVRADAGRLRQILLNLAGNAVKFTEEGSVTISAAPASDGGVDVSVRDTGIGIPPEAQDRIFEEFQQVDSPQTRRHGGAGLGLAIARGLAERMGGQITVTSEPRGGSTFTLHISGDGVMG